MLFSYDELSPSGCYFLINFKTGTIDGRFKMDWIDVMRLNALDWMRQNKLQYVPVERNADLEVALESIAPRFPYPQD